MDHSFKAKVHKFCAAEVKWRIESITKQLEEARASGNNETKSSAGDKHETGRAMAQLEQESLSKQLGAAQDLLFGLEKIDPDIKHENVSNGALVQTDNMLLYFGIALGQIQVEGTKLFAVSMVSPIGKLLVDAQKDDHFELNGKPITILEIV